MEFTKEFIEENQLTPEQINAISTHVEAEYKTRLGKDVHEHVEQSLGKVWDTVKAKTGIERDQGEKYASAIERATNLHFEGTKNDLARKIQEYDQKIKDAKGDETLKAELKETKEKLETLQSIAEEHEDWKKNDYKGKYESTIEKLTATERKIAFSSVRIAKPENVNEYEWKAKWQEFENKVLEERNVIFDENLNDWIAVKKNEEWVKDKLSDLVKQNTDLQELIKGRQTTGIGSKPKNVKIDGVPFQLFENATPIERQKAIKEYLASQNINPTSSEYSKQFAELNSKILGLGKKPANKK